MDDPFPQGMLEQIDSFLNKEPLGTFESVFKQDLMFPLQRIVEHRWMLHTAGGIPQKVIMEIGTDKAGSLFNWCHFMLPSKVIACEIRGTPYWKLFEKHFPQIEFLWIPGSSYDPKAIKSVEQFLGGDTIDCLFIDGDKTKFHVDFINYSKFLSTPSVSFFHDIQDPSPGESYRLCVDRFVNQEPKQFSNDEFINTNLTDNEIEGAIAYTNWLHHWNGRSCGVGAIFKNK